MSYTQNHQQITKVVDELVRMTIDELVGPSIEKMTNQELIATFGLTEYQVGNFRRGQYSSFRDVAEVCAALGLDVGISIRNAEGEEVTFYPKNNFGPNSTLSITTKPAMEETAAAEAAQSVYGTDYFGD